MSDSTLNRFVSSVADSTERLAFVPSPPTPASGPDSGYFLLQRDDNSSWSWDADSSTWVSVASAGGSVPATVQGDVLYASGTNTLAALAKNASATRYLSNTGTTNNPAWAQVALATGVSGILPVANGGTGSASGAALLTATVALTNAQILALPTTPITLVSAPGSGFAIQPFLVSLYSKTSAGAYTNIHAAAEIHTRFDATHQGMGYIVNDTLITNGSATLATDLLGTTTNKRATLVPEQTTENADDWGPLPFVASTTGFDNAALMLSMTNTVGNLTGGNAANTLTVRIYYVIETVP
jgi:hypothetical protein